MRTTLAVIGIILLTLARSDAADLRSGSLVVKNPLPPGAVMRLGMVPMAHRGTVTTVAFAPDGRKLASTGSNRSVYFWDARTTDALRSIRIHNAKTETVRTDIGFQTFGLWVTALAYSRDGSMLATGSSDGVVTLWDVAAAKRLYDIRAHTGGSEHKVNSVAFSPEGQKLASAGEGGAAARIWDVATGKMVYQFESAQSGYFVAFSPDGMRLAYVCNGQRAVVVDLQTSKEIFKVNHEQTFRPCGALSADGQRLAALDGVWDLATGKKLFAIDLRRVKQLAYSTDGKLLAGARDYGYEGSGVALWDGTTGAEHQDLLGHADSVNSVTFSPDNKLLASGSDDGTVRLWNPANGEPHIKPTGHEKPINALAYSADGKLLVSASDDQTVRLWDTATGRQLHLWRGHKSGVEAVALTPDGKCVVSGDRSGNIRRWNTADGKELPALEGNDKVFELRGMDISHDGRLLAVGSYDRVRERTEHHVFYDGGAVHMFDLARGAWLRKYTVAGDIVAAVDFSADGKRLALTSRDGTVRIVDVESGKELRKVVNSALRGEFESVEFSPDNRVIACGGAVSGAGGGALGAWDAATGKKHWILSGNATEDSSDVRALRFSPDGKLLAHNGDDGVVRIRDAAAGNELRTLSGHMNDVRALAFSPDGQTLATGGDDFSIFIWNISEH